MHKITGFVVLGFILSLLGHRQTVLAVETASSALNTEAKEGVAVKKEQAKKKIEDLPNFHAVHPFLYRSGEPTEAGLDKVKALGVKTVIDLRAPSEMAFVEKKAAQERGLNYINLVMTSKAPTEKQVNTLLETLREAKADASKGAVLVHCAHGSDRTGCMVGIWRVVEDGYDYDEAYKEMRKYWFTPKFTNLSGAVRQRARAKATN